MSSLKSLAIRGTIWTFIGYGSSQVLRLGANLILTRLLVPEVFGLMALVNTFIMGLNLFSDVGINPSIVRSERGEDPDFLNTAWTLQVIRGFGLWICCIIIAYPISQFYNEPRLFWLIPIVGLNTITSGFNSTSLPLLNRNMNIGKLTLIEMTTQITALVVMITFAYFNPSIWALVTGSIISSLVKLSWSHYISPIHHRFTWNQDCLKELISFGLWIFVSTAMTFLASQADRLILGKFLSLEMLGVYTIAFTFADIPKNIISKLTNQIFFPMLSQQINISRVEEIRATFFKKRGQMLLLALIMVNIIFFSAEYIINKLYDHQYKDAGWMLKALAIGMWPLILQNSSSIYLFAIAKPFYVSLGSIAKFFYMIVLLPLSFYVGDLYLSIFIIAFNDIPIYLLSLYGLEKENFSVIKQDCALTLILITSILFGLRIKNFY